MDHFPPGKGGGKGVARGGKGKGILIHSFTDATGMPLAHRTTAAHGNERAQVLPLLDALRLRTGKRGRPRKRLKVIATDQGYDAKTSVNNCAPGAFGRRSRNGCGRPRNGAGARSRSTCRGSKPSGPSPGFSRSTAGWSSDGSGFRSASPRSWPLPPSIIWVQKLIVTTPPRKPGGISRPATHGLPVKG